MPTTKKAAKKTTTKDTELRVLAFRIPADQFDALSTACAKAGVTKTQMVIDGLKKMGAL